MKKILLIASLCASIISFSQDKVTPVIKQGSRFAYIVHTAGQDVNFSSSIDSVSAGYLKLGWDIEGLGTGGWIMKKNSLEKATNGYWDQPLAGSDVELSDDQTVLVLSRAQWDGIQKEKKFVFEQKTFSLKTPSEQQVLKLKGRPIDAIMAEAENGFRVWLLNNASFPVLLKIENNPKGVDLELTSID